MPKYANIMFFIFVLLFWTAVSIYIFSRIWQAMALPAGCKIIYIIITIFLSISLPVGMILREKLSPDFSGVVQSIGGTCMIAIVYALLFVLFFDLLRLINHWTSFFPDMIVQHYIVTKRICLAVSVVAVTTILAIGHWRFNHPQITRLDISTSKSLGDDMQLDILFFSDLHLGSLVSEKQLDYYVDLINKEHCDIVLIGGDLADGDHKTWIERKFAEKLQKIEARYGVFSVVGNHEYYNGLEESVALMQNAGFITLIDNHHYTGSNNAVAVVGRDDRTNMKRLSSDKLLNTIDKEKYTIVLDHQPAELTQVQQAGADLLLCGHTHNGQMFPLTALIHLMWDVAYGHAKREQMDIFVSSGIGLWGPQYRIGSSSELVHIRVKN